MIYVVTESENLVKKGNSETLQPMHPRQSTPFISRTQSWQRANSGPCGAGYRLRAGTKCQHGESLSLLVEAKDRNGTSWFLFENKCPSGSGLGVLNAFLLNYLFTLFYFYWNIKLISTWRGSGTHSLCSAITEAPMTGYTGVIKCFLGRAK